MSRLLIILALVSLGVLYLYQLKPEPKPNQTVQALKQAGVELPDYQAYTPTITTVTEEKMAPLKSQQTK